MAGPFPTIKSLVGRRLGLGKRGNLTSSESGSDVEISPRAVNATITVGAEATNVRAITVQFLDANGNDVDEAVVADLWVFADATRQALATTGGSTGIAQGTDGAILQTVTAKKQFVIVSEADGDWDGTYTDTGSESIALGVRLPNGVWVMTDAFANAA